ncbi:hypothetical protein [Streptomyces sp. NPDC050428]|uniref:hypothetical protein n=1 Tax=Streptomyces sp. NPDC050428 TaxID=3155757 RepID=UPI0034258255
MPAPAPDLIGRHFHAETPGRKIVGDITYIPTGEGWLADEVRDQRAVTLAEAYARHPERFARRPRPPVIPGQVWINDPAKRREPGP